MTDLRQATDDYLRLRRSLGHQMAEAAYLLTDFVTFLDGRDEQTVTITAALDWVKTREPGAVVTTASPRRITAVRGFDRYLSGIDPATEVPPLGLVPYHQRRGRIFLYSDAGISAIMTAAKETITQPLRAATYHSLIGLLVAAGLRIGEAIKLDRDDIAWTEGVLHVRETKFGKSRLVPLQDSVMDALREYDTLRDQLMPGPKDPSLFVSLTGASGSLSPSTHRCTSASGSAEIGSGIGIPAANAAHLTPRRGIASRRAGCRHSLRGLGLLYEGLADE
jgi:integrase/recombinase XerD